MPKALTTPSQLDTLRGQLVEKSTKELKKELTNLLGLTSQNLLRLALVVKILEERGEDMSALKGGFLLILRRIAEGTLLPELVVMYAGEPAKILRAGALPLEVQADVVDGKKEIPDRKPSKRTLSEQPEQPNHPGANGDSQSLFLGRGVPPRAIAGHGYGNTPSKTTADDDTWRAQSNLLKIASNATPKDVADMASEMILTCENPQVAATRLLDILRNDGRVEFNDVETSKEEVGQPMSDDEWRETLKTAVCADGLTGQWFAVRDDGECFQLGADTDKDAVDLLRGHGDVCFAQAIPVEVGQIEKLHMVRVNEPESVKKKGKTARPSR